MKWRELDRRCGCKSSEFCPKGTGRDGDFCPDKRCSCGDSCGNSFTQADGKIKINYATKEEIETLPGIGPAKAEAIIQYREENGFFQSPGRFIKRIRNWRKNIGKIERRDSSALSEH